MKVDGAQVDVGRGVARIAREDLFVEGDGAVLLAGLLGLHGGEKEVLRVLCAAGQSRARAKETARFRRGIDPAARSRRATGGEWGRPWRHCSESQASSGADQARLEKRIGHSATALMATMECADGSGGHVFLAQDAQGPQLAEILEGVGLLRGNESGSLPTQQLAGTDLQDPQNILTAIAGHSSMLHIRPDESPVRGWRIGFTIVNGYFRFFD